MRSFRSGLSAICRTAAIFSLLSICVAGMAQDAAPATQDSAQPTPPALSVTTHEVLLDVVVTEGGRPVKGLKASDFTVLEEGKPQLVASLEEHGPMSAASTAEMLATPPLPPNTFSNYTPVANNNAHTVILLDAMNTRVEDQMSVRLELIRYLKHMQPAGPVAIFERDIRMHLVQGFTSDPKVLLAVAEDERKKLSLVKLVQATHEEDLQYRMDAIASGFELLGRYLAAFPGRKNLIWFTGVMPQFDFDNSGDPMGAPFRDDFLVFDNDRHDMTGALILSRVAVYPIDARALGVGPQFEAATNRPPSPNANFAFQNREGFQQTFLDLIAESTGGRAYHSSNGTGEKIQEIEANGSDYYTLTYATSNKNWNGEFRHIKIELDQPQVRLQYKRGYYAVDRTSQEQAAPPAAFANASPENGPGQQENPAAGKEKEPSGTALTAPARRAAPVGQNPEGSEPPKQGFDDTMQLGAVPSTEIILTAHVSEGANVEQVKRQTPWPQSNHLTEDYKYEPFRTYAVEFSVDPKTVQLTKGSNGTWHGSIVFVTVVYDSTLHNVNSALTTKTLDLDDAQYKDFLEHGLTERHEIAVPVKGSYFLRLGVHDVVNDRIGSLEVAVDRIRPDAVGQVSEVQ